MDAHYKPANIIKRVDRARRFPFNTCPFSRHTQMIGEALLRGKRYMMLEEEPDHCGGSILITVEQLYKARNEIARLRSLLGLPQEWD